MAITFAANFSKKLDLPNCSSHQYSVAVKTELTDIKEVELESARRYARLQSCVDRDIQEQGYLPQLELRPANNHHRDHGHHNGSNGSNGNHSDTWNCSEKQPSLILKIIQDNPVPSH